MASVAKHERTEELHPANEANPNEKYVCPHGCNETAAFVRSHTRDIPGGDITRVSEHFRYLCDQHGMETERNAPADYSGGGSGESNLHARRKMQAMRALLDRFDHERYTTEEYIDGKRCDALVVLEDPHETYGNGFVVEYQHKNEQKDIEATERHYARNNLTTLWLWEDEFSFEGVVPDVDLFDGRVFTPWPQVIPTSDEWSGTAKRYRLQAAIGNGTTTRVDATLKRSLLLPSEQEHWRQSIWPKRFAFSYRGYNEFRMNTPHRMGDDYLPSPETTDPTEIPMTLPPECYISLVRDYSSDNEPPKPSSPFSDIQCRVCGHYKHVSDATHSCGHCDTQYDIEWNIETGRIEQADVSELTDG